MKRIVSFLFLCTLSYISSGQSIIYNNLDNLKIGIYQNFNEFKYNNPSIPFNYNDYVVTSNQPGYGFLNLNKDITKYYIGRTRQNKDILKNAFGFCDGYSIYFKPEQTSFNKKAVFIKLSYIGRYCYYQDVIAGGAVVGPSGSMTSTNNVVGYFAIDITDGKVIPLTKSSLKQILTSDRLLLNEFENERHKDDKLSIYIIKYSEKHKDDYASSIIYNIDSLIYKLESDYSYDNYYERILSYSSDPSFISIELRKSNYGNGNIKYVGIKAKHKKGGNEDYFYKIGTWRYFYKNGQLKELINYDLRERKKGIYELYDENGKLQKSSIF